MNRTDAEQHLTLAELEAGLGKVRGAPRHAGTRAMIVRRPQSNEREVIEEGVLDLAEGLVGDSWRARGSSRTLDGSAHPDMQITVMNVRAVALFAQSQERWPLAGD